MVVSHGTGRVPLNEQRCVPRRSRTANGASAADTLIASSEVATVSTAQAARVVTRRCGEARWGRGVGSGPAVAGARLV
jgi:hypothetical protein